MTDARTPGTGGVVDLWKNRDGSPSKLAIGRWAEGQGRPQGVGSRWRGWYVGDDGQMRTKRFRTEVDADHWVQDQKSKLHTKTWINPSAARESFGALAEQWFTTKGHRKPKTLAGYRSIMDTIVLTRWRDVAVDDITYPAYVAWLSGLSVDGSQAGKPLSASRVTQTHQLVGAVLRYAVKSGYLSKNVAAEIDRSNDLPEATEAERRYLSHTELQALARHAGRFETMTLVLGYCGLRFGEAVALRRRHVGDRVLTIRASATSVTGNGIVETSTKTGKVREVPVPEPVWKRLLADLPDDPDALVFPSRKGGHLPLGEYRWAFDKACADVGIKGLVPHGLRHTTASLAISAGANVKAVQRLLGHASATMTLDRYAKLFDDDLDRVAKALGDAADAAAVAA